MRMTDLFGVPRPVIGVVHLPPLPGAPSGAPSRREIRDRMLEDLEALEAGGRGVHGVILENYGDAPFHPGAVPAHVVATMSVLAAGARAATDLPLGINVLRNDVEAALSVADAAGAEFVRANVWTGVRATDQGIVEGRAHAVLRLRRRLDSDVRVFADVDVKHSVPLGDRPLAAEVRETVDRGRADAVIVTGPSTGAAPGRERVEAARDAAGGTPVLVGSGVTPDTVGNFLAGCDGVVVGSALKRDGVAGAPVVRDRVLRFVEAARAAGFGD